MVATAAAALANSPLLDMLRCVAATLGRLLDPPLVPPPPLPPVVMPVALRLTLAALVGMLLKVECLLLDIGIDFEGEPAARGSRFRTAVPPFLRVAGAGIVKVLLLLLTDGGSGRGRNPDWVRLDLLMGESVIADCAFRPLVVVFFMPVMKSCCKASSGFKRRSGSHRRQRVIKSTNESSSHFKAC